MYKMERKVIKEVREEIANGFGSSINFLKIEQIIEEGLKKAREEGYRETLNIIVNNCKAEGSRDMWVMAEKILDGLSKLKQ